MRASPLLPTLAAALALRCAPLLSGADAPASLSPVERMQTARLQAAHTAATALQSARRSLPPIAPNLRDFRCIFHAHAEDSAHTGGTLPEMLADAKRAQVDAIFLGSHFRPPKDFMDAWRGLRDGVLFIPGSEVRGFLISPASSMLAKMEAPVSEFLAAATANQGLAFLSHIEERPAHSMEGLDGLEIYNRHYDAKLDMAGLVAMAMRLTHPTELAELGRWVERFPDEVLAAQVRRADAYLAKWDAETAQGRRLVGIAANDCHHNQVFIVKMIDPESVRLGTIVDKDPDMRLLTATLRPGIRELTRGRQPGDILARVDLDPYYRSFRNVSTHLLAPELTEAALRAAVKAGRAYVSHDWMCDPSGFSFTASNGAIMGDETPLAAGLRLRVRCPAPARLRLLHNGSEVAAAAGDQLEFHPSKPGAYRAEASLDLAGDLRPWIYSNPIYLR